MDINLFINKTFETAKNLNLTEFEIYFVSSENQSIKIFKGEVDNFSDSQSMGISFRVKLDGKIGYSYTESLEKENILPLINSAIENSKIIETEDDIDIYGEKHEYISLNMYNDSLKDISVEEKINFLLELEKEAYSLDKRVTNINYCACGYGAGSVKIKNSKELDLTKSSNNLYFYISVVVEENGVIKNGSAYVVPKTLKDLDAKKIAKEAVDNALRKLNPISIESGSYKILIENEAFSSLLGSMCGIFSAEAVQKGVSKFKGLLNTEVANSIVNIVDDPHLEDGFGSSPFDAEGVPTEKKYLIEKGVLKTFIHNLKTSKKDGIKSTGNASKGGYKGTMGISPFNLYLERGEASFKSLVTNVKDGIFVTDFAGLHSGLNSISGDFSLATEGFLIKDGKISSSLIQFTTAGNFFELLNNIEEIGEDLKFPLSSIGSPSIIVYSLNISI